jgi:hypothetical protein
VKRRAAEDIGFVDFEAVHGLEKETHNLHGIDGRAVRVRTFLDERVVKRVSKNEKFHILQDEVLRTAVENCYFS